MYFLGMECTSSSPAPLSSSSLLLLVPLSCTVSLLQFCFVFLLCVHTCFYVFIQKPGQQLRDYVVCLSETDLTGPQLGLSVAAPFSVNDVASSFTLKNIPLCTSPSFVLYHFPVIGHRLVAWVCSSWQCCRKHQWARSSVFCHSGIVWQMPGRGVAHHMVDLILVFEEPPSCFPSLLDSSSFPAAVCKSSSCPHPGHPHLLMLFP